VVRDESVADDPVVNLYRIRSWSRGIHARRFGEPDMPIFNGVNPDRVGSYPYVGQRTDRKFAPLRVIQSQRFLATSRQGTDPAQPAASPLTRVPSIDSVRTLTQLPAELAQHDPIYIFKLSS
jgi:hypothetical protein